MHFVCVCPLCVYSSLQCPVPVDPAVCPRYRGAAAAAAAPVCVGRPLYTVGPGARHALVSGLRVGRRHLAAKKQKKLSWTWQHFSGEIHFKSQMLASHPSLVMFT